MQSMIEIQKQADQLSTEDKAGLAAHLLASLASPPLGADNAEIDRRDEEMDSGLVQPISHSDFLTEVGRK